MPTYTTNYNFVLPTVDSSVDEDLWGTYLNTDINGIDPLIRTAITNEISAKTTSFTATANISSRYFYVCDASGGAIVATLPAASSAGNGATVILKKTDSSTNTVTATPSGSDTTDAVALSNQNQSVVLVSDGTSKWNVAAEGKSSSVFTGDSGSGGASGLVPAPSAGSSADDDFLSADGTFKRVSKLSTSSGSAPSFSARAWASINGATGAIIAGGNIASSLRNSTGSYSVTFTTNMASANYAVIATGNTGSIGALVAIGSKSVSGITFLTSTPSSQGNLSEFYFAVFL